MSEPSPEMIEAGVTAFRDWVGRDGDECALVEMPSAEALSSLVRSVFLAMVAQPTVDDNPPPPDRDNVKGGVPRRAWWAPSA
jgi:hypothetical protein